jgi:Na+/H+ antiporter NhaD/arsenite permease-like protein
MSRNILAVVGGFAIFCIFGAVALSQYTIVEGITILGIRAEFLLFALTLIGVALFHHHTLQVALIGLASISLLKILYIPDFHFVQHLHHEWRILVNLLGLLLGFALLAKHFEESRVPEWLPRILPGGWKGGFVLLAMVFVLSAFLDNIAAAMIGGTMALVVFKGRVDIGFLAAIVAASNAGGSGSVVGDTTTTMMWIDGVSALDVTHAYAAAVPALFLFGIFAALQQHRYQPLVEATTEAIKIDWLKISIVALILVGAIATNVLLDFPAAGVWVAILIGALLSKTAWHELPGALKGTIFLLSLVTCASMMPVDELPLASWKTAFALGFVSAVFDNIPLTKLALVQGGYDWGVLAYAVGFGGSMIWFGSSAGVALSNMFPQAKSVGAYLKHGWHVTLAYIISFFIMLALVGWHPHAPHKEGKAAPVQEAHDSARH